MEGVRLSVCTISFNHAEELERLIGALELRAGDELIVVDNASSDGSGDIAQRLGARTHRNPENRGFAAACRQAADLATGELLVFLNPDSVPAPGFREAIARPWGGPWSAWMGMVMDGDVVNTSGGVVHFTGLAWAGEAGLPAPTSPAAREVGFLSGACLAIGREQWERSGGFADAFFMYHEDVDLSLRLRLAGARIGVVPDAVVDHDYSFAKGAMKWRMLERNRWATILRCYPTSLLVAVAPALLALEIALWPVALRGGWADSKVRASADVIRWLPRLRRERRAIQSTRAVSAADFAAGLTGELSSPYLGRVGQSALIARALRLYWRAAVALVR